MPSSLRRNLNNNVLTDMGTVVKLANLSAPTYFKADQHSADATISFVSLFFQMTVLILPCKLISKWLPCTNMPIYISFVKYTCEVRNGSRYTIII